MSSKVETASLYRDASRLYELTISVCDEMPRSNRYSSGNQLQDMCVKMINTIALTYATRDPGRKLDILDDYDATFRAYRTVARVLYEMRRITRPKIYVQIIEITTRMEKQTAAWRGNITKRKASGC